MGDRDAASSKKKEREKGHREPSHVFSAKDRMKMCIIFSKSQYTDRSALNLAAEWRAHNIHYAFTKDPGSSKVNLDFDFWTNRSEGIWGTIFAVALGAH